MKNEKGKTGLEYPDKLPYESKMWPKVPIQEKRRIISLKERVKEYEKNLYEPWKRLNAYSLIDTKIATEQYRRFASELYRLENEHGLTTEAKEFCKSKLCHKHFNFIAKTVKHVSERQLIPMGEKQ